MNNLQTRESLAVPIFHSAEIALTFIPRLGEHAIQLASAEEKQETPPPPPQKDGPIGKPFHPPL